MQKSPNNILVLLLISIPFFGWAQQTVQISRHTVTIPDSTSITSSYKYGKYYLEYGYDTLFYYHVKSDNGKYTYIEKSVVPFQAIDKEDFEMEKIVSEYINGTITTEYRIGIWITYNFRKDHKVWSYQYYGNGKKEKDDEMYIVIYSKTREVYDRLKNLLNL